MDFSMTFHDDIYTIDREESIPFGTRCHAVAAPGLCTALHYLCRKREFGLANHFFWAFGTGENLDAGDPILVLRTRLLPKTNRKLMQFVLRDEQKAPMIVNAWNLLRKDRTVRLKDARRISWHGSVGQKFPKIL